MSVALSELGAYLDQCLQPGRFNDYCPNGLQVEGRDTVAKRRLGDAQVHVAQDPRMSLYGTQMWLLVHNDVRIYDNLCTGREKFDVRFNVEPYCYIRPGHLVLNVLPACQPTSLRSRRHPFRAVNPACLSTRDTARPRRRSVMQ